MITTPRDSRSRSCGRRRSRRSSPSEGSSRPEAIDRIVEYYENDVGPQNGARVVARSWVDADYRARLLDGRHGCRPRARVLRASS